MVSCLLTDRQVQKHPAADAAPTACSTSAAGSFSVQGAAGNGSVGTLLLENLSLSPPRKVARELAMLSFGSPGIKAALAYVDSAGPNCREAPVCGECDNMATQYCPAKQCKFNLCDECAADHIRRKRTKDHKLLLMDDTRSQADTPAKAPSTAKRPRQTHGCGGSAASNSTDTSESDTGLEGDTESDSDSDDNMAINTGPSAPIPAEQFLIDKNEDELVLQLVSELSPCFVQKCNHNVKHHVLCIVRKFKGVYKGKGKWDKSYQDTMPEIIAGGVTQNGKTFIKAVGIWVAWRLGAGHPNAPKIATVVMSTGVNGTGSLFTKMVRCFSMLPHNLRPPISFAGLQRVTNTERRNNMLECILQGGCIFVNDTAARVKQVQSAICEARGSQQKMRLQVQVFMDEADAFYRNADKKIKLEIAIEVFISSIRPIMRMSVSATLIPVFLHLKDKREGVDFHSIIYTKPGKDYNGVQDFKPLLDDKDAQVFLSDGDLTRSNGFSHHKLDALYKDAFAARRSLTLNISNPAVTAKDNVHDHARKIQCRFPHVGCLVFVGKGITYYPPKTAGRSKEDLGKIMTIGDVIQHADAQDGLEMPLVIIGYSQMIRGDSFRSNERVPTHICVNLGRQMSIEKMVQAMGRATYGESKLQDNGFEHVTVLTLASDYDTAQAYPVWLQEMSDKLADGMSIQDALSPECSYTDKANVKLGQSRTTGQKQDKLWLETSFSKPTPGQERDGLLWRRQEIWKDPMNKLVYQVAVEHFRESVDTFRDEMLHDAFVGGSSSEFLNTLSGYEGVPDSALNIKLVRAALQALVRYAALMLLRMYVFILVLVSVSVSLLVSVSVSLWVSLVHAPVQCASCISLLGSLTRAGALLLLLSFCLMHSLAHYRSRTRSYSPPFSLVPLRALSLSGWGHLNLQNRRTPMLAGKLATSSQIPKCFETVGKKGGGWGVGGW